MGSKWCLMQHLPQSYCTISSGSSLLNWLKSVIQHVYALTSIDRYCTHDCSKRRAARRQQPLSVFLNSAISADAFVYEYHFLPFTHTRPFPQIQVGHIVAFMVPSISYGYLLHCQGILKLKMSRSILKWRRVSRSFSYFL